MTYLLTWSCYGLRVGYHPSKSVLEWRNTHLRCRPFRLSPVQRAAVLSAIQEYVARKNLGLIAAHVRETHVHVIVASSSNPARLCSNLKAEATRYLRHCGLLPKGQFAWADYAHVRRLHTEEAIQRAFRYVVSKQGPPMALWHLPPETPL
jgi:REP element-mobilizing transposase RayT